MRLSSVTTAATRLVSLRRMNPMPVTRVGQSAKGAIAASVCAVSDTLDMSASMPLNFFSGPMTSVSVSV